MRRFLLFAAWFTTASILDSMSHDLQDAMPADLKWLHVQSIGFVAVLWIGAHIGRHYNDFIIWGSKSEGRSR